MTDRSTCRRRCGTRCGSLPASLAVLCSFFAWTLACSPPLAVAQFGPGLDPSSSPLGGSFPEPPYELRKALYAAQAAIKGEQYAEAVAQLGFLLNSAEAEDFFLDGDGSGAATRRSLKALAREMLAELPKKGRDLYQLQFGREAERRLDDAIESGDFNALMNVSRLYFHTKAGHQATLLIGRREFDRGHPLAAALAWKRLKDLPGAAEPFEPALSVWLAAAWRQAGQVERAEETLAEVAKEHPQGAVMIAGQKLPLPRGDFEAWLVQRLGLTREQAESIQSRWLLTGGNPARNGRSRGDLPLFYSDMQFRWQVPVVNDPRDEQTVGELRQSRVESNEPRLPVIQPLAVRNYVLMRTPERLIGVDFETGKRIWEYPWHVPGDESASSGPASSGPKITLNGKNPRENQLEERLWEDAAYGQVTSDGRLAFLLEGLDFTQDMDQGRRRVIRIGPGGQRIDERPASFNQLVAVNLEFEGKTEWIVGGEQGLNEPKLAGAFFLGPPLPMTGELYCLAEIRDEVRLVVLDARTGKLKWSQQIAQVGRDIQIDMARRLSGATPSFADGVLICPTGGGAVVAVDLPTRSLLWGYEYPNAAAGGQNYDPFGNRVYPTQLAQSGNRWNDGLARIADGKVLLTPVESQHLICLDLVSGKEIWKKPRGNGLFVACVHDGKVVVVEKTQLTALNLLTGEAAWASDVQIPNGAMPSGRGYYSDRHYYLPTTDKALVKIDLREGQAVEMVRTNLVLGNLICYQDEVISQNVDYLTTYYQTAALRRRVARALADNPQDPWALARKAELDLHDGKQEAALAAMRQAVRLDPENDEMRALLVKTLLVELKRDFAKNQELVSELEPLIKQPRDRAQYLRIVGGGRQQLGQTEQALEAYLELIDLHGSDLPTLGGELAKELEQVEQDLRVRRDRWIQARLGELFDQANQEQQARMEAALGRRVAEALERDSVAELRSLLIYFGRHPLGRPAQIALAKQLVKGGKLLEAQLLLDPLAESDDPRVAASARVELTELLLRSGRVEDARRMVGRLAGLPPETVAVDGRSVRDVAAKLEQRFKSTVSVPQAWLAGRAPTAKTSGGVESRRTSLEPSYPVDLTRRTGSGPAGLSVSLSAPHNFAKVAVRDGQGQLLANAPLSEQGAGVYSRSYSVAHGQAVGNLVVVSVGPALTVIDASGTSDPVLWRRRLGPSEVEDPRVQMRMRINAVAVPTPWNTNEYVARNPDGGLLGEVGPVTRSGVVFQDGRDLICADPLTGDPVWMRSNLEPGLDLWGDDSVVLAAAAGESKAQVFSIVDGRLLRTLEIPNDRLRYATHGRNVLTWENASGKVRLRMIDPLAPEKPVFVAEYQSGAKGQILLNDELAVMEPSGRFTIRALATGEMTCEQQWEPERSMIGLHVLRSERDYLVFVARSVAAETVGVTVQPSPGGFHCPFIYGPLYAIDRESREMAWQSPAFIDRWGLPMDQPSELPVVTLMRYTTKAGDRGARTTRGGVLCLDRRDGSIRLLEEDIPLIVNAYKIIGDVTKQEIGIEIPGNQVLRLKFTDEPVPPEPPAQLGDASSDVSLSWIRGAGNRLFGLFGPGEPPLGPANRRIELFRPPINDPFDAPALPEAPNPFGR